MNVRIANYSQKWYPLRRNIKIMDRFKIYTSYPIMIIMIALLVAVFIRSE
jgi:hypothetical protein